MAVAARASQVLTNADPEALANAAAKGGEIILGFDGTVNLSHALVLTTNTTIDASGHSVVLDGGGLTRHLLITNAPVVRLINLSFINGRFTGAPGDTNQAGGTGRGGSINSSGATLELLSCSFVSNIVTGGLSGPGSIRSTTNQNVIVPPTDAGPAYGGAICLVGGILRLTNCVLISNIATGGQASLTGFFGGPGADAHGGAIYCTNCSLTMSGVAFRNNAANAGESAYYSKPGFTGGSAYGGAVSEANSTADIHNCVFENNEALSMANNPFLNTNGFAFGGAVFHDVGDVLIDQSIFASNSVRGGFGGGLYAYNFAGSHGGAVHCRSGTILLQRSSLIANQATGGGAFSPAGPVPGGEALGGAIYSAVSATNFQLINCTLAQNSVTGGVGGSPVQGIARGPATGAAVYGSASMRNVTIASNSATGGFAGSSVAATGAVLVNTILACGPGQTNFIGNLKDAGHNISSDGSALFNAPSSRNNLDPLLAPLGTYGGPSSVYGLLPNSPAIDAGDDLVCPPTDERGALRPSGLACDIGAFELTPSLRLISSGGRIATVEGSFQGSRTNRVSRTTDFVTWASLGLRVADTNGAFEIEQVDLSQSPLRFYRVEPSQ